MPEHAYYDKTDLNPFFYCTLFKPLPQWFLAVETAMLQIYSTVYDYTNLKINSQACITKTYLKEKPFPFGIFALKCNFLHVHFSEKEKSAFGLDQAKYSIDFVMSHMHFFLKMALPFIHIEII